MTPDARLEVRDLPLPLRNTTGQRILRAPWEWAALGAILLAASGHLIIKLGLAHAVSTALPGSILGRILHYALNPVVLAGLAVYGTGTLLWIYAVSQRSISFLYPITALNEAMVAGNVELGFSRGFRFYTHSYRPRAQPICARTRRTNIHRPP